MESHSEKKVCSCSQSILKIVRGCFIFFKRKWSQQPVALVPASATLVLTLTSLNRSPCSLPKQDRPSLRSEEKLAIHARLSCMYLSIKLLLESCFQGRQSHFWHLKLLIWFLRAATLNPFSSMNQTVQHSLCLLPGAKVKTSPGEFLRTYSALQANYSLAYLFPRQQRVIFHLLWMLWQNHLKVSDIMTLTLKYFSNQLPQRTSSSTTTLLSH